MTRHPVLTGLPHPRLDRSLCSLRDAEDNQVLGEFRDKQDQVVSGVIQQGTNPHMIQVDLGSVEAVLPPAEQVPGEHNPQVPLRGPSWLSYGQGNKRPPLTLSRSNPGLLRKLFKLKVQ